MALAVVVGLLVAPVAWGAGTQSTGKVAVIPIAGTTDGQNVNDVSQRLIQAREDPSIQAVTLVVNSGGGPSTASNELYMQVSRTAGEMPVVAVIDGAGLSGAYYGAIGADKIYAKPSTPVGSVGTILTLPPEVGPLDDRLPSGPDKLTGNSRRNWEYYADMSSASFYRSVRKERGDALNVSESELRQASVYVGVEAVEKGFVDGIGDLTRGVQEAADLAGLPEGQYTVETLRYDGGVEFVTQMAYVSADSPNKTIVEPTEFVDPEHTGPGPTVLMMPPGTFSATEGDGFRTVSSGSPEPTGETPDPAVEGRDQGVTGGG